ncbi:MULTISPECIES: winged helix-turn-helix domain-containing protein [unclassified Haladaptatus]|uniref:ArsR/SmtB family transcription factor n=1 Tax=unclassified Haladaptatus TaxID=2622732 RepID=UPI0009EE4711|nr:MULTISPECIES: winged helix-turn-helix domain-containing protein [unclassified Haladaptatus]MCO8243599.1 winged helix-turn-helix domain-containing protein [Haladaptatus sp. AB643]MCO8255008.1 winged helix-turn-helix domain-containing protein [Haladaptatus sp. AB618]
MNNSRFTRQVPNARSHPRPRRTLEPDGSEILSVATAMGSDTRWEIIKALSTETRTIHELTELVGLSKGTVSVHVKQLEEAGLAASRFNVSDNGGVEKEISLAVDEITVDLSDI